MSDKEFDKRTSVTIDLEFPIEVDGQRIESVTMRRPKVIDSLKAKKTRGDDMERGLALLADLCGLAPEHIYQLDEIDAEALQAQYESFRGGA